VALLASGARTSIVTHLYVVEPAFLTNRVELDNFDDNRQTGWSAWGTGSNYRIAESNQQLAVSAAWPGAVSHYIRYFNHGAVEPNYDAASTLDCRCTTPMPPGGTTVLPGWSAVSMTPRRSTNRSRKSHRLIA
jgi:hypothetical protein